MSAAGAVGRARADASLYDVAATWRERATNVTGKSLPGTHYFAEEIPEIVAKELREFFKAGEPDQPSRYALRRSAEALAEAERCPPVRSNRP